MKTSAMILFALKNLDKIKCDIQTEEIKNHRLIIIERITNIVDKIVSSNLRSLKLHPNQDLFFNNSVFLQIIEYILYLDSSLKFCEGNFSNIIEKSHGKSKMNFWFKFQLFEILNKVLKFSISNNLLTISSNFFNFNKKLFKDSVQSLADFIKTSDVSLIKDCYSEENTINNLVCNIIARNYKL
jgi:hypothetical protein